MVQIDTELVTIHVVSCDPASRSTHRPAATAQ
jgi:hypothetical protein